MKRSQLLCAALLLVTTLSAAQVSEIASASGWARRT